ncbi:MAG: transferrin-binding protein-like solute binding protein [Pseudomonadota bacterium]
MTVSIYSRSTGLSALALITLAACGGGGGTGAQDAVAFQDAVETSSSSITVLGLNAAASVVARETGTLDREANTLTYGSLSGTLLEDRSGVDLDDGAITFDGEADAAAVRFEATQGTTNTIGVIGVTTAADSLPTGTATYTGDTVLTAVAGTDVFELTGVANVTAEFDADTPTVTTALSGLSGTRQPVLGAAEDVADAGTLTISGSEISGAGFSGGEATLDSTVLTLSGDETVAVEGSFFGVDADEVGGVFVVDDDETRIFGDFLAD